MLGKKHLMTSMLVASGNLELGKATPRRPASISFKVPSPIATRIVALPVALRKVSQDRMLDVASPAMTILMKILSTHCGKSD